MRVVFMTLAVASLLGSSSEEIASCNGGEATVTPYEDSTPAAKTRAPMHVAGTIDLDRPAAPPAQPGFASLSGGTYTMGSPTSEPGHETTEPQHSVTLTAFQVMVHEVTQTEFVSVMGYNPSYHKACGACPVEQVTWGEAARYANLLSERDGLSPLYTDGNGDQILDTLTVPTGGYRLPSEAEWEYAARANTATATYAGNVVKTNCDLDSVIDRIGWYSANSPEMTQPYGLLQPNGWGLYDMIGNVGEYTGDWWVPNPKALSSDPMGPTDGANSGYSRSIRGGGIWWCGQMQRAAWRISWSPAVSDRSLGFRLVYKP